MRKRLYPLRDYVLNHIVNRVPIVAVRMRLYRLLGVQLADHRSGMLMLGCLIYAPAKLTIEPDCAIGRGVILDARGELRIGRSVNIGSGASFQTANHEVDSPTFADSYAPIVVGDRVWVAEGARVLGGVTIGEGAVVAAGSIVTKDVAPYTVVAGVPARYVRDRNRDLTYELGWRRNWL